MTKTLNGKQVLALLAQDEPPEIEYRPNAGWKWATLGYDEPLQVLMASAQFRIKPTPQRRLSVTLANGEVVSWPEPVREALGCDKEYWFVDDMGDPMPSFWDGEGIDLSRLAFGNVHLTREAAQEHADTLRKINMQEVV